jgi:hypothetical protein
MSFSWSGDPDKSLTDAVRHKIGDTDPNSYYLEDEQIQYELTANGNSVLLAAAACCESIAGLFAKNTSWVRGRVEIRPGEMSDRYHKMADRFREEALGALAFDAGSAHAGGISVDRKADVEADDDRVSPQLYRDQFEPT